MRPCPLTLLALAVFALSCARRDTPEINNVFNDVRSERMAPNAPSEHDRNLEQLRADEKRAATKTPAAKDIYRSVPTSGVRDVLAGMGSGYGGGQTTGLGQGGGVGFGGIGIGGGGGLGGRFGKMGGGPSRPRLRRSHSRALRLLGRYNDNFHTESYKHQQENGFHLVSRQALSTFSIDVDTASYSNIRRFLSMGQLPPKDAVRIEEMINYFNYDYAAPKPGDTHPFTITTDVAAAPWNRANRLLRVGIRGKTFTRGKRPSSNLVFLIDVSGSMGRHNKLPLLKQAFSMLLQKLDKRDRVSIVVYAGSEGVALPPTTCDQKQRILDALDNLRSGGSTHGSAGILKAYSLARRHFIKKGVNRVILATDGDFNVGVTSEGELVRLVKKQAQSGVFLTVLGFGMGNYKDSLLEALAGKGNGNYAYIDTLNEARKVLVRQLSGTLHTIAKDVKIQVEFNPTEVKAYRLVGYENRILAARDFNDDKKDAGEIGAGHMVTALYELVLPGGHADTGRVDPLRYQALTAPAGTAAALNELVMVKVRYKKPQGKTSTLITHAVSAAALSSKAPAGEMGFAAAVAAFGMLLRDSAHKGNLTFERVLKLARTCTGKDRWGYRKEFLSLVKKARDLKNR